MVSPVSPRAGGADPARAPLVPDSMKEKITRIALLAYISLAAFVFFPADAAVAITTIAILAGVISLTNCVIIPIERRSRPFFGFWPFYTAPPSVGTPARDIHHAPTYRPSGTVAGISVDQPGPRVIPGAGHARGVSSMSVAPPTAHMSPAFGPYPGTGPAGFGTAPHFASPGGPHQMPHRVPVGLGDRVAPLPPPTRAPVPAPQLPPRPPQQGPRVPVGRGHR